MPLPSLERFDPGHQRLFRAVRSAVKKRLPTANELVYDYTRSVVIGYTPTEHAIDGVASIMVSADGVRLYFNAGKRLPDPGKLLEGSAGVRYLAIESARQLAQPEVTRLFAAAIAAAKVPLPARGRGRVIDRSAAQKQRAARKRAK